MRSRWVATTGANARPASARSVNGSASAIAVVSVREVPVEREFAAGELVVEPFGGPARDLFERAGFFEQVGGARHDLHRVFDAQRRGGLLVEADHLFIAAADDEQRRRLYLG